MLKAQRVTTMQRRICPRCQPKIIPRLPVRQTAVLTSSLDARLHQLGLRRRSTLKDGNCLFSAVSILLENHTIAQINAATLRQQVCDFIESNLNLFEADIKAEYNSTTDFLFRMRKSGTYGCNIVLSAFSILFNVNFYVHFPTRVFQTYPGARPDLHIVFLQPARNSNGHWEATELF